MCYRTVCRRVRASFSPEILQAGAVMGLIKKRKKKKYVKLDVLYDCLQACPCIFQPGNFTGWGSEGVN